MLKSALRYIRQKPKAVRNQYALVLSSIFTLAVVFVWGSGGIFNIDKTDSLQKASEGNTPFSNLIKQAKDQFASSKLALDKAGEATSSTSATTTTTNATAEGMILTTETLEGIDQTSRATTTSVIDSFGFSSTSKTTSVPSPQYIEVRIATTTRATATAITSPQ